MINASPSLRRLKSINDRRMMLAALREGLSQMSQQASKVAQGIIDTMEADASRFPSMRQVAFTHAHGSFRCVCGKAATRVSELVGRCDAHAVGMRAAVQRRYYDARNRDRDKFYVYKPSVKPYTHNGGTRLSSTLERVEGKL